jgi:hypothetical protein
MLPVGWGRPGGPQSGVRCPVSVPSDMYQGTFAKTNRVRVRGLPAPSVVARMIPIGPGGLQSGFSALKYVRRDFRKKLGPRTPRPISPK